MSGCRGGEPATDVDSVTPCNRSANGDRLIGQCSSHTKWITWNARSSDRWVGSACARLWWFSVTVRMIRGCFVAEEERELNELLVRNGRMDDVKRFAAAN